MRWAEIGGLLVLAWLVAVPLTRWFASRTWTAREPIGALLAWQAIGLAGGLAVLTGELTLAATGRPGPWRAAVIDAVTAPASGGAVAMAGTALLIGSAVWLLAVLAASFVRVRRARAGHRVLLELLATPNQDHGARVDVIEGETATAYSLPRSSPRNEGHVVVTTATRDRLDPDALRAIVDHERAHLRQRHGLLVQPFVAWEHSLPFLVAPALARRRVEQLVELACDEAACRTTSCGAVTRALRAVAPDNLDRTERLTRLNRPDRNPRLRIALVLASVVLVASPPVLLVAVGR